MMELLDMGYKDEVPTVIGNEEKKQPKTRYPSFSLHKNIPENLSSKDVGEMCRIELIVKVIGKSIDQYSEDRNERIELEIHKMGFISNGSKLSKGEYLKLSDNEKLDYDKKQMDSKEEGEDDE